MNFKLLILSFVIVFLVAFIGSQFTDTGDWYENTKPSITPPNYVFPVVWNILFILIAISFYLTLTSKATKFIIILFSINFILNILWSFFYFKLKNPHLAFIDLILLWIIVLLLIKTTNKTSGYLLIPYLLWVTFAGVLNYLIIF